MIKLTDLSTKYGAPMGRSSVHRTGLTDPVFELERVPLVDGGYDCGGAYWGIGERLWVADFTTPRTKTEIVHYYIRANSREEAMHKVWQDYKSAKFKPETGSVIEQTIEFLNDYLDTRTHADYADEEEEERDRHETESEISYLEEELEQIRKGNHDAT